MGPLLGTSMLSVGEFQSQGRRPVEVGAEPKRRAVPAIPVRRQRLIVQPHRQRLGASLSSNTGFTQRPAGMIVIATLLFWTVKRKARRSGEYGSAATVAPCASSFGGWAKLCAHCRRSSSLASVIPMSQTQVFRCMVFMCPWASPIVPVSLRIGLGVPSCIEQLLPGVA